MKAADRLLAECRRAAAGGPDPYAAVLTAQFGIVAEYHARVLSTRQALTARSQLPEWHASFLEQWSHLQAASAVYDIAMNLTPAVPASQWDAQRLHRALHEQAALVSSLTGRHREARADSNHDELTRPFARRAAATRTFIAGLHAAFDLDFDAAAMLAERTVTSHDAQPAQTS